MHSEPLVEARKLQKSYDGKLVIENLDLTIHRGEFLTLLGPSGSGKTTLLMMLAGFEAPTAGEIFYQGRSIANLPPHARNFGVVFQNYALFPHMSVFDNVGFPLSVRKLSRAEIASRVRQALAMVQLEEFGERRPPQLSGGQQQRVALARALVFEPDLVLMDEPLGALDKNLREQLQVEIKHLHDQLGITVVYVTHDQTEAMVMSDRIAIFNRGRIQQLGAPRQVHEHPATAFVARFMGEMNAFTGKVIAANAQGQCEIALGEGLRFVGTSAGAPMVGSTRLMGVRPERIMLNPPPESCDNMVPGRVAECIYLGDRMTVLVAVDGGLNFTVSGGVASIDNPPRPGMPVHIGWSKEHCLILEPD
ncbi:ABC transporter ATP-binding protein [Rhodoligotrophos defluvii]|uniref:ABC transporter ATP-binding protein n=1 Tax=Rhodoligotrophos defluvii TaxID=2561934 RepID=UPI001EEFC110|nr:ABC transporter ATP-binding protein [Rhodoligotrophos defluvii]